MNLLRALLDLRDRPVSIFPSLVIVLSAVLCAVLAPIYPAWAPLFPVGVLAMLAIANQRTLRQFVQESHGAKAFQEGRYAEAEAYFRKSMETSKQLSQKDRCHGRLLEWLMNVAKMQGKYDDAEGFARAWLDTETKSLGNNHMRTIKAMVALGTIYIQIARYQQAMPLLENALRISVSRMASRPAQYASCLQTLGTLLYRLERYDKAEPFLREAYDLLQKRCDPNLPLEYLPGGTLCMVLTQLGELKEAEWIAKIALTRAEQRSPADPFAIASSLTLLANVRRYQEQWDEAEALVNQAIELGGTTFPLRLDAEFHLLGVIRRHQSRWAEAEECFRETLRLRDEYLAPEDLATARVLEDYAELLDLMDRTYEAHALQHRARQIRDFHSPFRIV